MNLSYVTVAEQSCEEIVINKSRFIGYAAPCETEEQALSFLQSIRDEHKTATHHCYAYIIGENASVMRYSDNGESSEQADWFAHIHKAARQPLNQPVSPGWK